MPNTELGHIEVRGKDAEKRASAQARETGRLSWDKWANRVNEYLGRLEALFSPDLFIIGGGISRKADKFLDLIDTLAKVVPAELLNNAGIVGVAMAAAGVHN